MSTQLLAIKTRFTDDTGAPLKGGQVYTFYAGTSTPKETYKDVDLLIPNTNPVILDDTGAADIYLKGSYRIRVLDRFGALIEEQDDVSKIISRVDAGELVGSLVSAITNLSDTKSEIEKVKLDTGITSTPKHVGAIARSQAQKNDDFIDIRDFTRPTDADHTAGLQAAAAVALAQKKKLQGSGTYIIKSADVSFRSIQLDLGACKFIVTDPYKIIMGGDASTTQNPTQVIGDVQNVTASLNYNFTNNPTVRVIGAKNQRIKFGFVQYLQFYQSTNPATYPADASQAYSTFDVDCAVKISVDTDPAYDNAELVDGAGKGNQWFNENTFNLNRCYGFFMRGSYPHNHNLINGGSFEGNSVIRLESGRKNHFKQMRFEGTKNSIYLGERTQGNIIEKSWYSSEASFWTVPDLTDLGKLNSVRTSYEKEGVRRSIMSLSVNDAVFNKQKDSAYGRAASTKHIKSREAKYTLVGQSKIFTLAAGDYIFACIDGDEDSYYTASIVFFDENRNLIEDINSIDFESSLTKNTGRFSGGFSRTARFAHYSSSVKYAQVSIFTSADTSRQTAKRIDVFTLSLKSSFDKDVAVIGKSNTHIAITEKPTEFVGEVGDAMRTLDGTTYVCQHIIYTKLTATASLNEINVDKFYISSTGSSKVGDLVGVELNNKLVHWSSIATISSNDITLATALPSAAAAGNTVYISRLA